MEEHELDNVAQSVSAYLDSTQGKTSMKFEESKGQVKYRTLDTTVSVLKLVPIGPKQAEAGIGLNPNSGLWQRKIGGDTFKVNVSEVGEHEVQTEINHISEAVCPPVFKIGQTYRLNEVAGLNRPIGSRFRFVNTMTNELTLFA